MLPSEKTCSYYLNDSFMQQLWNPKTPEEVNPDEYAAVYFAGGHGTMEDFPDNEALYRSSVQYMKMVASFRQSATDLLHCWMSNCRTAAICWTARCNGFTDIEEKAIGLYKHLPFSLEQKLKTRGTIFRQATLPFEACITESGRLITGQNPASVKGGARRVMRQLDGETWGLLRKNDG